MADKLDEAAEFWLPAEFLTEEDIVMDTYGFSASSRPLFGNRYGSFSSSTGLSSPVESLGGTETESDEDESLSTELTRVLKLLGRNNLTPSYQNHEKKGCPLSRSPQSTLGHMGNLSGRGSVYTNGGGNGPFNGYSASNNQFRGNEEAWDLIYKAANQVAPVKNHSGVCGAPFTRNPAFVGPLNSFTTTPPPPKSAAASAFYQSQLANGQKLLEIDGYGLWNRPVQNGSGFHRNDVIRGGESKVFPGGFSSHSCAWPSLEALRKNQLSNGLNLGDGFGFGSGYGCGSGADLAGQKSERVGTGVFMPRRYESKGPGNACTMSDSRKKLGSPTVWLPAKGIPPQKKLPKSSGMNQFSSQLPSQLRFASAMISDEMAIARRAALVTLQRSFPDGGKNTNHDACLPQEWTY